MRILQTLLAILLGVGIVHAQSPTPRPTTARRLQILSRDPLLRRIETPAHASNARPRRWVARAPVTPKTRLPSRAALSFRSGLDKKSPK